MKSSRELFEAMYAKHTDASHGYTGDLFARNGEHYIYPHVQAAWFGWDQRDKMAGVSGVRIKLGADIHD